MPLDALPDGGDTGCVYHSYEWLTEKFGARKARAILARIEAYFEKVRR